MGETGRGIRWGEQEGEQEGEGECAYRGEEEEERRSLSALPSFSATPVSLSLNLTSQDVDMRSDKPSA